MRDHRPVFRNVNLDGALPASIGEIFTQFAQEGLRPPDRVSVSEAAEKYRKLNNPGAYVGPYLNAMTPYLVEPMNVLTSREYDSMVFVGAAQTGKSEMFLTWLTYSVLCDPMDMLYVDKSQTSARDFSMRRLDRLHVHSEEVGKRTVPGYGDNVFDKHYKSGMIAALAWPSINELSGRPIPRVWLCDYDRMPQNIDGEGAPFDLARKRTTTFGGSAMTVAESSPGFVVDNPKWIRSTPHEAPSCTGVLALYNRGDRRRWYWKCPHCESWFEPEFSLLKYDRQTKDALTAGDSAMMLCPNAKCGFFITPDMKPAINRAGRWVKDGQWLDKKDQLQGTAYRSKTASFWLKGVAAAFANWATLVSRYVQAEQDFSKTNSQETLKSVVNTDLGEPYYPRGSEVQRTPDQLKEMSVVAVESKKDEVAVPSWVRFLIATVDIQRNRFVVQVTGVGPREGGWRMQVVDYWPIIKSNRLDDEDEHKWVRPSAYLDDWFLLKEQVLDKRYSIEGDVGTMGVAHLGYDTGGQEGVVNNAYAFYREMKKIGQHQRVFPLKGDSAPNAPRVTLSYPDSRRKDRRAGGRGEVPVLMMNPNLLKDGLQGMVDRAAEDSDRTFAWPDNLPEQWYAELCAEHRDAKGWQCPKGVRNEAWDCSYYALGMCLHLKVDRVAWDTKFTPSWARPHAENPYVVMGAGPEDRPVLKKAAAKKPDAEHSLAKLAETLA